MAQLEVLPTEELSARRLAELRTLLDGAFDGSFSDDDWEHTLGGWHVLALEADRLLSHAGVVRRQLQADERVFTTGYVESVATHPARQGSGLGTAVMGAVNALIRDRFELGGLSSGLHTFYGRLGWERWQGRTFVREASEWIATPDDDDGIMVLRFGSSSGLDLTARLSCEMRTGDVW